MRENRLKLEVQKIRNSKKQIWFEYVVFARRLDGHGRQQNVFDE